ncbi:MAG: 1,3-beta-galactosyl-N-acetylhexosamine phosphorylase [Vallitalea sp.]|jgi:1,3-beta-galactosyl-N-acetylhexosamine phosphorylase|nr:1,3-beta-galactosyl-N-acetylhexosamine phosphorylase [Vallitalea sp.]
MGKKGRVTLPTQEGMDKEIEKIIEKWGADAIRNSDGTQLSDGVKKLAEKVYATYFLTRSDQEWAKEHPDQLQQMYLMSNPSIAKENVLEIDIMDGYFTEQVTIDTNHDPKEWWEVVDRTSGEIIYKDNWEFNKNTGKVIINEVKKYHSYTVSFLVYQIWDATQMYNHITNDWGDKPHEMPYDVRHPETKEHILSALDNWCKESKDVDVVRFTTFFYHFTLVFNNYAKEKFVDWFGYSGSVSPLALEEFEKEKGYKLTPEDIIDEGYYNSPFRIPKKEFLDWLDFQQKFVSDTAKECVEIVHKHNKEAMMFLGDNWIGTEPYGKYFQNIGIDAVVGSVGNGTTMRMISDIPGVKYTEGRFLPYFFPDVFCKDGDPVGEANTNWLQARRAILRKPIDRMGYGGYLNLALEFPEFVERVEEICNEFREIHSHIKGTKAYTPTFKVAVLNSWGKLRTWMTNQVAHALWYKKIYSYVGLIEALSGMAVDVEFISFEDIKKDGIKEDIGVIINAGDEGTAWSGGNNWLDEVVVTKIRNWVNNGGGFIGIGEPTAYQNQGRYFQLADVLGVDKELGYSLSTDKYGFITKDHFILEDQTEELDFGESMKSIYGVSDSTQILAMQDGDTVLAVNTYGKGRSVYMAGLPYSPENSRLLLRSIYWAVGKENEIKKWYTTNVNTECTSYEEIGEFVIINNTNIIQETVVYKDENNYFNVILQPMESKWLDI